MTRQHGRTRHARTGHRRPGNGRLAATAALLALGAATAAPATAGAQQWVNASPEAKTNQSNFRALEDWPAPNDFRAASGAPGARYWQQRVDYVIRASLDTAKQSVTGSERVTYHN